MKLTTQPPDCEPQTRKHNEDKYHNGAMSHQQQTVHPAVAYREIIGECQQYMQKIAELEVDRNEHILVEETLTQIEPSRRAYRWVSRAHTCLSSIAFASFSLR